MADAPNTPPRKGFPPNHVRLDRTDSSTPHRIARTSVQSGGTNSGTHDSVDEYALNEINGRVLVGVDNLVERWLFPARDLEKVLLGKLVGVVIGRARDEKSWEMPGYFSDRGYLPWVGGRMREVCEWAAEFLVDEMARLKIVDSNEDSVPGNSAWLDRLRGRIWAVKPGNMTGGDGTRAVDIVLSATPNEASRWDTALVIGEHKSEDTQGQQRKAITQLAGYAGDMFGVQPFRHFVPGFTILRDQMQLWFCDRMGCFGSTRFSMSTDKEDSRRKFVEVLISLAVMDYDALGFDPDVYSDVKCTTMWTPTLSTTSSREVSAYVRVQGQVFHLQKVLFIRPGLVCRGTRCFLATCSSNPWVQYIVKFSWRFEGLQPEGALLERVGRNEKVRNVVRVHAFDERRDVKNDIRKGQDSGRPFVIKQSRIRKVLLPAPEMLLSAAQNRVFTRTVLKDVGQPLIEVSSALELIRGVRDSFIGHGTLYFDGGILHRDISRSNLLLRPPSSPLGAGFLIDLDYAIDINPESLQPASSGAPHRTGTLPYMAIDILNNNHGAHLYHHDVESFLYVLLWCCVYNQQGCGHIPEHSDDQSMVRRGNAAMKLLGVSEVTEDDLLDPLANWRKGAFNTIGLYKRRDVDVFFEALLVLLRPGFDVPPVLELLRTLRAELFGTGPQIVLPSVRMATGWDVEQRKRDERVLFENTCKAMERAIRLLEA
ncbi:hypothetical protein GP486_003546 [Trichoglossum hirsutum]|uniref:Fungal-type protein kinase domain-containing protein n=1 Tax=Trichoglossum hirsutum TaxID=265104 RepID=A0A9P8RQI3_9PEZI|nr:hypothetical protein GP486_003546 [Trichoglossum hirsutum]